MTTSAAELEEFKRAVSAACATFSANFQRGDAAAVVRDYYTADASMIAPDAPRQKGPEALAAVLNSMMESGMKRATLIPVDLHCEGDLGYEIGNAQLFAENAHEPVPLRYVVVWRRIGGEWKAAVDMFSPGTL